ncbi:MAG: type I secretion C-terminal target domain-containing protein, partial [Gammaproteobacteria bacterium]
ADGDTDTAQLDVSTLIGFGDSTPEILSVDNASIDNQVGLAVSGQVTVTAPDQPVSFSLAPSLGMEPAGISYSLQPDGSLIARDATGEAVFTLSVDASGRYTFTLLKVAPEEIATSPAFSGLVMNAGKPTESALTLLYQSYDSSGNGVGAPVTSVTFSSQFGNLQPSNDGLGIGNNLIDNPRNAPAEALTMRFSDIVSNASLHIGNLKSSEGLVWKVYKEGVLVDEGLVTDRYTGSNGQEVDITNSESPTYWIDLSRNGLDPDATFDSIEISGAEGTSYKFIAFTIEKPVSLADTDFRFAVQALDADGDPSGSANFSVLLDGSGNVISDTAGDTVLMGGSGSDVFAWSFAESGAEDTIADFSMAAPGSGGDVLDLHDLLPSGLDSASLTSYLQFESGDTGTVLKISSAGAFTGDAAHDAGVSYQSIELQGVDLLSMGNDQQIIDYLKSSGKLITDG